MRTFDEYKDRYRHLAMSRHDGILHVALHTDGGPYVHSGTGHADLPHAFHDIGADRDNVVMILSGTGDVFCTEVDHRSFRPPGPESWFETAWEGRRLLTALLDIDIPVIGVANGPAHIHSELLLLSDMVVAAESATFQDAAHLPVGFAPSDGMHVVWPFVIGELRGKYFLLTQQVLSAAQALEFGAVNEVVPDGATLDRAEELARQLVALPALTLRYTRIALTNRLNRVVDEGIGYGLALEGLAAHGVRRPS